MKVPHLPKTFPVPEHRVAVSMGHIRQDDVLTYFLLSRHIVHVPACVHVFTGGRGMHTCVCICTHVPKAAHPGIPRHVWICRYPCSIPALIQEAPLFFVTMETKRQSPDLGRTYGARNKRLTQSSQKGRQIRSMRPLGYDNLGPWGLGSGSLEPSGKPSFLQGILAPERAWETEVGLMLDLALTPMHSLRQGTQFLCACLPFCPMG